MSAVPAVAAAYSVVFVLFVVWAGVMLRRFGRRSRELSRITRER